MIKYSYRINLFDRKVGLQMKEEFRKQIAVTVIIVLVSNVLNTIFQQWIFSSIGHVICGLIWIVHPVKINDSRPEKSQFRECRIAGAILIVLGIMLRARLY